MFIFWFQLAILGRPKLAFNNNSNFWRTKILTNVIQAYYYSLLFK